MLIGGDDISNDVITLGTCFSMFVYIRARFRVALIGGNLTAQSTRSHGELEEVEFKFQRRSCRLSFFLSPRRQSAREPLARRLFLPLSKTTSVPVILLWESPRGSQFDCICTPLTKFLVQYSVEYPWVVGITNFSSNELWFSSF